MIIITNFRKAGGLARHLLEGEGNAKVVVRLNLFRLAPDEVAAALRYFQSLSNASTRTKRHYVHAIISPKEALTKDQVVETIDELERIRNIAPDHPRIVIEHLKGDRVEHLHIVWPVVHPATGRAIKSNRHREEDYTVSREMELRFGHDIVLAQQRDLNELSAKNLEQRGIDTTRLRRAMSSPAPHLPPPMRISKADRQQGARVKVDPAAIIADVVLAWNEALGRRSDIPAHATGSPAVPSPIEGRSLDPTAFHEHLMKVGLRLARGDKTVQVVDAASGAYFDLARSLREAARAGGQRLSIKQSDLAGLGDFPSLDEARDRGFDETVARIRREREQEEDALLKETKIDGEVERSLIAGHDATRTRPAPAQGKTLKARREAILAEQRERDGLRKRRIDRAFKAAQWLDDPIAHRVAYLAAGGGVLLAGGGLGLAFIAACVATALVPSFETARALKLVLKLEQDGEWAGTRLKLEALRREVVRSGNLPADVRARAAQRSVDASIRSIRDHHASPKNPPPPKTTPNLDKPIDTKELQRTIQNIRQQQQRGRGIGD